MLTVLNQIINDLPRRGSRVRGRSRLRKIGHRSSQQLCGRALRRWGAAHESSADIEIVFGPMTDEHGNAWVHFRAPDGNIYEFTQDPGVSRPA